MTSISDRPETRRGLSLWRPLTAATLAGLVHGLTDGTWLYTQMPEALFGVEDGILTTVVLCGLMVTACVALTAAGVGGHEAISRLTGRPAIAAGLLGALATVPLYLLNGHVLSVAPTLYWIAFPAATLTVAAGAWGLARITARGTSPWLFGLLWPLAAGACYGANATVLRGLYRGQHATLTYLSLALTLLWLMRALPAHGARARRAGQVSLALGIVLVLQALVALPSELGQRNRAALFTATVEATHVLDGLALLSDWDGDGSPALLGGGDCDDGDPVTFPGAWDQADDGVDQDCLGGDATTDGQATVHTALRRRSEALPRAPTGQPVILISVDALRADRASSMAGYRALADAGVRFERAYAPAPSTILSLTSTVTGRAPGAIATERWVKWDLPKAETAPTLAEVLGRAGYDTHALFFHHIFETRHGITRGFDSVWTVSDSERVVWGRSSEETTDRAIAFLDDRTQRPEVPYLLWVHYYDPHEPYVIHPELPPIDEGDLVARYDAEIQWTDRHLMRLVKRLQEGGELDRALVVFTADHGESLGEHGRRFHGSALTEEQIRVPLVISAPGVTAGQVRSEPVSLLHLTPTLLDRLGLRTTPGDRRGTFSALLDGPGTIAPVFTELRGHGDRQWAVLEGPWKLIYHPANHLFELFNVVRDPRELLDVYDLVPDVAAGLETTLGQWMAGVQAEGAEVTP